MSFWNRRKKIPGQVLPRPTLAISRRRKSPPSTHRRLPWKSRSWRLMHSRLVCPQRKSESWPAWGPGNRFRALAPDHAVLHIATHAFFTNDRCVTYVDDKANREPVDLDSPLLLSGLVLAGANHRNELDPESNIEDGIPTTEEIASLDLSGVDWAVLSACETGAGQIVQGEGVLGLRRGFRIAGARTLIMSLWKVDDAATRELMKELYIQRRNGSSTNESMRRAAISILEARRRDGRSTNPYYWGAFVASGDWR